jgi:hypothetical protein
VRIKEAAMKADSGKKGVHTHSGKSPAPLDAALKDALQRQAREGELPCAVAFELASELGRPPADIGEAADRLGIRLVKCQLGLFGYSPEKKIVQAAPAADPAMETAIREKLENGRLNCRRAWEIAVAFQVPKMAVSAACEALQLKIKPCQLGAF